MMARVAVLAGLTFLSMLASFVIVADDERESPAEIVIGTTLLWSFLIAVPAYLLGFRNVLTRNTLGSSVGALSLAIILFAILQRGARGLITSVGRALRRMLLAALDTLRTGARENPLVLVGMAAALWFVGTTACAIPFAPTNTDWDCLWYHEPIVGFTIQNHGFKIVDVPDHMQMVNGVPRLCEITQLWFAIFAGRAFVESANIVFMPMLVCGVYGLCRSFDLGRLASLAWGLVVVMMPGNLRLLQSTMVDPQAAALTIAAGYYVMRPTLRRSDTVFACIALSLSAAAKVMALVPVGLLAMVLAFRLLFARGRLGGRFVAFIFSSGTVLLASALATTYLRNWLAFKTPFWPWAQNLSAAAGMLAAPLTAPTEAPPSALSAKIHDVLAFYGRLYQPPFSPPHGHDWQVDDYGAGVAVTVLPLAHVALIALTVSLIFGMFRGAYARPEQHSDRVRAWILALIAFASFYVIPLLYVGRYNIGSVGLLVPALAGASNRLGWRRLVGLLGVMALLVSGPMLYWGRNSGIHRYPKWWFDPGILKEMARTPYPDRELRQEFGAPAIEATAIARERQVKQDSVVVFRDVSFSALLFNNDYSNKVIHLQSLTDPLGEAEALNAEWAYAPWGTVLDSQLRQAHDRWEVVGALGEVDRGEVYHRLSPH